MVRTIKIGSVVVGGEAPVSVQTMGKLPLRPQNTATLLQEMKSLRDLGCRIIRFAVPDEESIEPLRQICAANLMPVVADIHFDHRLALAALTAGVSKIRINPGNIGTEDKIKTVLHACADAGIPIRVGINGGSLPVKYRAMDKVDAALAAATEEIEILEKYGFQNALFSLKLSDAESTVDANRRFRRQWDYPLHIGVTEAGPLIPSVIRSTVALTRLLNDDIGETLRISISGSCRDEVMAGVEILRACNKGFTTPRLVSCPKCGRARFDVDNRFAEQVQQLLYRYNKSITVAVMGCEVNGPLEAADADIGLTGAGNAILFYKKGRLYKRVDENEALSLLTEEIEKF